MKNKDIEKDVKHLNDELMAKKNRLNSMKKERDRKIKDLDAYKRDTGIASN